jgi:hypothetical protein
MICALLSASAAIAQGQRGGGDGGGYGGRGGRGGGNRSFSPEDMLRRLDTNGNGMLEEDEVNNSPAKPMIERILSRMGIPAKYPIAISDIANAMQNMRQNRPNNGQPGGGRGQRPPRNGQSGSMAANGPANAPSNNSPNSVSTTPNGPGGFGEAAAPQPASLGFGEGAGVAGSTVPGAARDPALDQKIRSLAEAIVRKYDKNSDSRLDGGEWPAQSKWGTFAEANRSGGGSIGVPELTAYLTDLSRRQSLSFDVPDSGSSSGTSDPSKPRPKRFLTARERLPSGLPDWFLRAADDDGQVTMAQYAANYSPEEAATQFAKYDLNQDGIITAAECLKAEKQQAGQK